ncbi:MAG: prepilin-type N-terminal cleavage/methylation domain-containing protein [Thermodesulfobacteriota bacterium]|nr:prepilin-type N-terminal cleavage/methylation domain-containing protein [Thermodesulfobacteriota bacterium]
MRTIRTRQNAGFTLVEIAIIVAIIAILSTIAIPSMQGVIDRQRVRTATREFMGLFNRTRAAAVHAPVALGSTPYQITIDCGTDSFLVSPVLPGGGSSSYSAADDFKGVNIYAVEPNLNTAPGAEQSGPVNRSIERTGSVAPVSGTRNLTVFLTSPRQNKYRVQILGTIGTAKILQGW